MTPKFHELAERELTEAFEYYEAEYEGRGHRFLTQVELTVERMTRFPTAGTIETGNIRRMLVPKFPYKLIYAVDGEEVLILAVAHGHRRPDYWIQRR